MNCIINRSSGQTPYLQQVPTFRQPTSQMHNFLLAVILKINDHPPCRRFGNDSVEGHHDNPGVGGLFDSTVQGVRRGRVNDNRVVTLENQVLNLCSLGRHFFVCGGEDVGGGNDPVGNGFLGDDLITLQHGLTP
jgi:hypothetical protein